jgi:Protein of unknown function (DUF982)
MDEQSWSKPVTVETGLARLRTFTNTNEASHLLLNHCRSSKMRLEAMRVFLGLLADERPPDEARTAFVEAAQEAGIFEKP